MKYRYFLYLAFLCQGLFAQTTSYKDQLFTEYFRQTGPGWVASDGTISMPLPDGRVLWFMGDSYLDNYRASDNSIPCLFQVRNTILVQDASNRNKFTTIIDSTKTGVERTPVKMKVNDNLFWPNDGYAKGDTAYTFWTQCDNKTMANLGTYMVKIHWPSLKNAKSIVSFTKLNQLGGMEFGQSVYVDSLSNEVYIYGSKLDWIVYQPYVARCSMDNILGKWEFYNGTGWTEDLTKAGKILSPVSGEYVSSNYSVIRVKNKFYLISQEIGFLTCGLGRRVWAWSGDTPYGPFSNKQLIYVIEDKYKGQYMITYNGQAHPEFTENDEILWSYNVNNITPMECNNGRYDADLYRPKFIRVPFSVLDSGISFKPEASFSISPDTGVKVSTPIQFDPSLSLSKDIILTYFWDFGDGSKISTNSYSKTATHKYTKDGIYHVKLTIVDNESLTDDTIMTVTVGNTTGIKNITYPDMQIYPNPTTGKFTVKVPENYLHGQSTLQITNVLGVSLYHRDIICQETTLDLKDKNGLFFVAVFNENEKCVSKLIVQN